jgi:hypothetical protein
MNFGKHFLAIFKRDWQAGVLSEHFAKAWPGLDYAEIEPTWENFSALVKKIETGVQWDKIEAHQEEAMMPLLSHPDTRLRVLRKNKAPIGYALIGPPSAIFSQFNDIVQSKSTIEIHNLALFKGQRGNGLGKPFFEMMFKDLFEKHDTVVWGTSDFNADTLVDYYKSQLKMRVLGYQPANEEFPQAAVG